ncbi:MAG: DUF3108 domain-containing protein [Kofleriaceae bacterium]
MRCLILVLLAGCEPNLAVTPLPTLVTAPRPAVTLERELLMVPGETMIWDVHVKGFTIARAELVVGDHEVSSRVKTGKLASSLAAMLHESTTTFDRTRALALRETFVIDGETTRVSARFDRSRFVLENDRPHAIPGGNLGHTIHTALGWLRAWAAPGAASGALYVLHVGELYRLEFAEPVVEQDTLKVDCRVVPAGEDAVSISIWLTLDRDRTPRRIEISNAAVTLTAELVERATM